jgi:hypothetical protein
VKPDSLSLEATSEAFNLRFAPRPMIEVDDKDWSLLQHADQETLLNCLSGIDLLRNIKFQEFKLVHKIEADNFTLTMTPFGNRARRRRSRYAQACQATSPSLEQPSEGISVRWFKNEKYQLQGILDKGKSGHRFPRIAHDIAHDIELADLRVKSRPEVPSDGHCRSYF